MKIPKFRSDLPYLTAAPLLTAVFLLLFYALANYYPFGTGLVSWCDMDQQVIPLLLNLKDILSGEGSALYSFQNAGGMNFWGVFFFFLASPFSFLTVFVPKSQMLLFMNILVLLKLSTCAFTASFYFLRTKHRLRPELAILFGVFYAFSGYGLMFYQNIIWLDMMYLFPLLLLSFEHLLQKQKSAPYVLALSTMMVVNYYIGYMVVLFTLLYFGIVLFSLSGESRKQAAIRFLIASFIAALLTAVVWLPSFLQYLSSGRDISIFDSLLQSNLYTHYETTLALLLPSSAVIAFTLYGLTHQPLQRSQLKDYLMLAFLLVLPIFFEPINKMWHTGNYQSFPVRYGFMTIFMIMSVAAQLLAHSPELNRPQAAHSHHGKAPLLTILVFIGIVVFMIFTYFYISKNIDTLAAYSRNLWGSLESLKGLFLLFLLAAALYLILLRNLRHGRLGIKLFTLGCLLVFLTETYANTQVYMFSSDYDWHLQRYQNATALCDFSPKEEENGDFYRVKLRQKYFDVNLVGGIGFPSLSHYTSLTSQDYMFAMKKLGYSSYWMEVGGYGGSLLSNAALSVAYDIHWFEDEPSVFRTQQFHIAETPYYLPLGIATTESLTDTNNLASLSRIDVQKLLYNKLLPGYDSPFTEYEPTHSEGCLVYTDAWNQYQIELKDTFQVGHLRYSLDVTNRQTLYFDCFDRLSNDLSEHINGSFHIVVNDSLIESKYPSQISNGLITLGTFENETVEIDIQVLQSVTCSSFGVFSLDHNQLGSAIDSADTVNLKADQGAINGTFHTDAPKSIFLSIPYDKGWTLKIDGKEAELSQAFLGFTAFTLDPGTHNIQLTYLPPGFAFGLTLTLFAMVLCLLIKILQKQNSKIIASVMNSIPLQKLSIVLVRMLFLIVILLIYVLPLCFNLYNLILI